MNEKTHFPANWPALFEPFRAFGTRIADWFAPASEASVDDNSYKIKMEVPGVAEGDIALTVDQGMVTITGEKKSSCEEKGETWYFSERQFGSFSRSFRLPPDADEAQVKASLRDGVLSITIPKQAPSSSEKARRVPIVKG